MPHEQLKTLKETVSKAMADQSDVTHLGLLQAIAGLTSVMDRVASNQTEIGNTVHSINTRLAVLESTSLTSTVSTIDARVDKLELAYHEALGASAGMETLRRWAPTIVAFIAAIIFLVGTGAIRV